MSNTAAISSIATTPPGAAPRAAASRALSDEVDLYAEGNAFSEADWAGPEITDLFGKDGFNFKDLVDVINPLQHLPVVGTVYRALTGDELAPAPRVIGGTLFGGIAGFVVSLANTVLESETGRDSGDTILALFSDDTPDGAAVADASAATPVAAAAAAMTAPLANARNPAAQVERASAQNATPAIPSGNAALAAALGKAAPNETEDPTAALIRARAAVPHSARSSAAAIPTIGPQASLALPGGKALPIHFRSGIAPNGSARASAPAAVQPQKKPEPTPGNMPTAAAPRALRTPAADAPPAAEATAAVRPGPAEAQDQDREIASKMMNALDKYQTLMRSRTAPSISSEI